MKIIDNVKNILIFGNTSEMYFLDLFIQSFHQAWRETELWTAFVVLISVTENISRQNKIFISEKYVNTYKVSKLVRLPFTLGKFEGPSTFNNSKKEFTVAK